MLAEVLQSLAPQDGKTYVDATFGNGGYTEAILKAADCKVIALDRDPNVRARAEELKSVYGSRFDFRTGQFGDFAALVTEPVDGAVFDIGVSSMQLDEAERGFSFAKDAPLDMRMSCAGMSAADIVNTMAEKELADLIYKYGEERKSRQIAARIAAARLQKPIQTTKELAEIISRVKHDEKIGVCLDTCHVSDAGYDIIGDLSGVLDEFDRIVGLDRLKAAQRLISGGKLVVVSFHSLEDRIVKTFFKENSGPRRHVSRYRPENDVNTDNSLFCECSKAIVPDRQETEVNKRSRSAKLRFAVKK